MTDLHPEHRAFPGEKRCHDNTWRRMLEALLVESDRVLMDLRSFSVHNAGCRFELEQIVRLVPTRNIVLICDKTTDLTLLRGILDAAWQSEHPDRHARESGEISVVRMERQTRSEFAMLMQRLQRA